MLRFIFLCLFSLFHFSLQAKIQGRADAGPAFIHIDVLESGHTVRKRELYGIKGDTTVVFSNGVAIKPSFLGGTGDANLINGSFGLGFCIPFCEKWTITPLVGVSCTYFESNLSLPHFPHLHLKEKIKSYGPYLGLDLCWTFLDHWRLYVCYQYMWSRVHTIVKPLLDKRNNTQGPNYALAVERDITDRWSINLGAAYNISLSKEKHGIRGYGIKLGATYWF